MARTAADVLVDSGRWLRDSRLHRGLRQRELAVLTGVSTSTISRIELGQGGSVPMATWLRLADAVEVDLVRRAANRGQVLQSCLPDLLEDGGWRLAWQGDEIAWFDRPARWMTDLRSERAPAERLVVRLVVSLTDAANAMDRLLRAIAEARGAALPGLVVGGALLVPRTSENRMRARAGLASGGLTPVAGSAWVVAMQSPRARMPLRPGLVWLTPNGTGLRGGW
jgi:transcriptional regulator with XRE-family HTH domain